MASRAAERARTLVRRYLDPRRSWSAGLDAELRALTREDEAARALYRRAVTAHRLMTGGDPAQPSGFEQGRMMAAVVEGASARPERRRRGVLAALGVAVAAAALLLVVLPPGRGSEAVDPTLRARGAVEAGPLTGLGLSGVTQGGGEYEIVASGRAFLGDWVRFYTTNERPELRWVFVLGLQPGRPVAWYAPLPPEETRSLPLPTEKHHMLPMENRLSARHVPGPLRVVALFTTRALGADEVAAAVRDDMATMADSELEATLRSALGLEPQDVVQLVQTHVVAGQQKEVPRDAR